VIGEENMNIANTYDYLIPQTRKRLFVGKGWNVPLPIGTISLFEKFPYLKTKTLLM
jgi:hypothetical protein